VSLRPSTAKIDNVVEDIGIIMQNRLREQLNISVLESDDLGQPIFD
jgi:hypothetical protein